MNKVCVAAHRVDLDSHALKLLILLCHVDQLRRADEGEVQIDMFVESLGDTPLDRQEKLLTLAQGALTAEDQANILRAVDRMDIAPGPNVSDLFDNAKKEEDIICKKPTSSNNMSH